MITDLSSKLHQALQSDEVTTRLSTKARLGSGISHTRQKSTMKREGLQKPKDAKVPAQSPGASPTSPSSGKVSDLVRSILLT